LWSVLEHSGAFWSVLEHPGVFWSVLEHSGAFWSILEHSGVLWNVLKRSRTFWSVLKHSGTFWSILEHSGTFWSLLEHSGAFWSDTGTFWSVSEHSEVFWNIQACRNHRKRPGVRDLLFVDSGILDPLLFHGIDGSGHHSVVSNKRILLLSHLSKSKRKQKMLNESTKGETKSRNVKRKPKT
jgi:hypothetical protein